MSTGDRGAREEGRDPLADQVDDREVKHQLRAAEGGRAADARAVDQKMAKIAVNFFS